MASLLYSSLDSTIFTRIDIVVTSYRRTIMTKQLLI